MKTNKTKKAMKTKMQKPTIKELAKALTRLKPWIEDEFIDEPGDTPHIPITLACDESGYALQSGDNSYSGPAYFYKHWSVRHLTRSCNARELAKEMISECQDDFDECQEWENSNK